MFRKHPLEKMTKAERMHYKFGADALTMIQWDIHDFLWARRGCPKEWHQIAEQEDRRDTKRTRCTVAFDADVVKFFKTMGPGYQHRMNRVLRAFMHMRLAKVVHGPDTSDYVLRPEDVIKEYAEARPEWGDDADFWVEQRRYSEERDKKDAEWERLKAEQGR